MATKTAVEGCMSRATQVRLQTLYFQRARSAADSASESDVTECYGFSSSRIIVSRGCILDSDRDVISKKSLNNGQESAASAAVGFILLNATGIRVRVCSRMSGTGLKLMRRGLGVTKGCRPSKERKRPLRCNGGE